jgi:hypothetical protein
VAITAALLFSVPAATYVNGVKTILSWKSLSIKQKAAIVILTAISCGIFLLVVLVYYFVSRDNPKSHLAMLRASEAAPPANEVEQLESPIGLARPDQFGKSASAQPLQPGSIQPTQPAAAAAPVKPAQKAQTLADYAEFFPQKSYIDITLRKYLQTELPQEPLKLPAAKNWENYFSDETAADGSTYLAPNRAKVLAGMKCFLNAIKSNGQDSDTIQRLAVLVCIFDYCSENANLENNVFDIAAQVFCECDTSRPNRQRQRMQGIRAILDQLFMGQMPYFAHGKCARCAAKIAALRSDDPLKLFAEFISLFKCDIIAVEGYVLANGERTSYAELAKIAKCQSEALLDTAIWALAFRETLHENEQLRALTFLLHRFNSAHPLGDEDTTLLRMFGGWNIPCKSPTGKILFFLIDCDIASKLITFGNRHGAEDMERRSAAITLAAAKKKWPTNSLEYYADKVDDAGAIAEFIRKHSNSIFLPDPPHIEFGEYLACMFDGNPQFTEEKILGTMAHLFPYSDIHHPHRRILLSGLCYIYEHRSLGRLMFGVEFFRKLGSHKFDSEIDSHMMDAAKFIFDMEYMPCWQHKSNMGLLLNNPKAFVEKVNRALADDSIEEMTFKGPRRSKLIKSIVKCCKRNREMRNASPVYNSMCLLCQKGYAPRFSVAGDITISQCLTDEIFPEKIMVDGTWVTLELERIELFLSAVVDASRNCPNAEAKNELIALVEPILVAAGGRWLDCDFTKYKQLLNVN